MRNIDGGGRELVSVDFILLNTYMMLRWSKGADKTVLADQLGTCGGGACDSMN